MSKLLTDHVFTSESVSEGHPDKVCDQISDAILDACLAQDPLARVACETLATSNLVVNAGEITCRNWNRIDPQTIARQVVKDIGYVTPEQNFSYDTFTYVCALHGQSPDIAQGVDRSKSEDQGAGDQGMMFGYATTATKELMPAPIVLSHHLLERLTKLRKNGEIAYLRPDAKAQVSVLHENGTPTAITGVVISHQTDDVPLARIRKDLVAVAHEVLDKTGLMRPSTKFYINPTGKFVLGGPQADSGVTGRKIIVDSYGGVGSHGGGAFSGKDPSKVDRSAAYFARYVAKNIVASGLASECELQVSYAIGVARPTGVRVDCHGTEKVDPAKIEKAVQEIFDFRPAEIIRHLQLLRPNYRVTAAGGHFGRSGEGFTWERTDAVEALRRAVG